MSMRPSLKRRQRASAEEPACASAEEPACAAQPCASGSDHVSEPTGFLPPRRAGRRGRIPARRIFVGVVCLLAVVFVGSLVWLNGTTERVPLRPTGGSEFAQATVDEVLESNVETSDEGEMQGNQRVMLTITSGRFAGQQTEATSPFSNNSGAYCETGLHVIVLVNDGQDGSITATVYNYDRGFVLWALIALFALLLCVAGGRSGTLSAIGLAFTFACIFFLYLPLVYRGASPFWTAVLTVVLVTVVGMYLIGGWSVKTLCSILGTVVGVLIAGVVASAFGYFGHISGLNVTDVETLAYVGQNSRLDVSGLLFSGILISSLGAVMDIAMSVTSTVCEVHARGANLGFRQLFGSGMTVGRDMMGTMSHTLILAFAGGAVNTLVIIYAYSMPYLEYWNQYDIGIDILRGLSGSIGIILAVPFTAALTAFLLARKSRSSLN